MEEFTKKAGPKKALHCRWHKIKIPKIVEQKQTGAKIQSGITGQGQLGGHQWHAVLLESTLLPKTYPDRTYQ